MPTNFSGYQNLVNDFNSKYNVNFRYEAFETDVQKQQYLAENFANMGGNINGRFYERYFSDLYRQALTNYADRKIDSFNSTEFIQEYAKMMNGYKDVVNKEGAGIKAWPDASKIVERVQRDLNDPKKGIPDTKEEYIIKRYNEGKLPMRQMRAHAKELVDSGVTEPEKFSTILAYANALEEINSHRPRWWRIIHPFRNNAEKRDAKDLKKLVNERIGKKFRENSTNIPKEERRPITESNDSQNSLTDNFLIARAISRDSSLLDAKNEIKELSEKLKLDKNALNLDENKEKSIKENVVLKELSETVNMDKTEPAVSTSVSTELNNSDNQIKQEEIKSVKM